MKELLSKKDRENLRNAVAEAEKRTSGEIVPYIATQSANYEIAIWKAAVLGGALAYCALLVVSAVYTGWRLSWLYTGSSQALVIVGTGLLAAGLAAFVPSIKRTLAGRKRLAKFVHRRALQAFVEREVFDTRDRTGILLYVSLFEHRIEVLGDAGINQKVTADDWSGVVLRIREGIKAGQLADGLLEGIRVCGELLHSSGVEIRPDDTNELSDEIIVSGDV